MNTIIIESDRDKIGIEYLRRTVGEAAISAAVAKIPTGNKPYISNVARILKIEIPKDLEAPPPATSSTRDAERERLKALRDTITKAPTFGKAHK